tara:strand:- start:45 stop:626 length:582 start_codon:yes stop_codon:yes gene_type:complete
MKKLLGIMVLCLLWSNPSNSGQWGEGELQLTKSVADHFIKYLRGKNNQKPSRFYVTLDGTNAYYWYCNVGNCWERSDQHSKEACKKHSRKECEKFAIRRLVRWNNDINPRTRKESTFNSKWSDAEIYAKLTELGFYKNNFSKNTITETTTNTTTGTTTTDEDIVSKIKELKKLYDDGILTLEEFKKAKKKLLN